MLCSSASCACQPCQPAQDCCKAVRRGVQHDETVKAVAEKLGKNPAAVLVRWAVQHGTSGERILKSMGSLVCFTCSAPPHT